MTHAHRTLPLRRSMAMVALAVVGACQHNAPSKDAPAPASAARVSSAPVQSPAPYVHALDPMDGSHLKVTIVEVRYGPGESSKPHSHPCPVIGYILEGAYRTQVRGEAEAVFSAGQSFYEAANGAHIVSANASTEKPVRFLAYFTCDRDTPLMRPVPDSVRTP